MNLADLIEAVRVEAGLDEASLTEVRFYTNLSAARKVVAEITSADRAGKLTDADRETLGVALSQASRAIEAAWKQVGGGR